MRDSFIDRHAAAERKDQNRDDQRPEIDFCAVAERMGLVRRFPAEASPEQQQPAVAGIDERMDCLGKHCRAAGNCRGNKFGGCNGQVTSDGRNHRGSGFALHEPNITKESTGR